VVNTKDIVHNFTKTTEAEVLGYTRVSFWHWLVAILV